jgi:hypothetical protein
MAEKENLIASMRRSRIESILGNPPRGVLISGAFRRLLCRAAVLFSYVYFAFMLIPRTDCEKSHCEVITNPTLAHIWLLIAYGIFATLSFLALPIMVVSFFLLRRSMRRVTSLPDEYLDEREIANRDWAFRTGYLVVRRIGLGSAVALAILSVIGFYQGAGWANSKSQAVLFVDQLNGYVVSLVSNNAVAFFAQLIALLTYVAYSFPLILLAWRESKIEQPEAVKPIQPINVTTPEPINLARNYFVKVSVFVAVLILGVAIQFLGVLLPSLGTWLIFSPALFYLIFAWAGYGVYVYIWASRNSLKFLKQQKSLGNSSTEVGLAWSSFALTQALGIALLSAFVALVSLAQQHTNVDWLGLIFGIAFSMIPAQVLSFIFIGLIQKNQRTD